MSMIDRKDGLFRGEFGGAMPLEMKELDETGEFEGYASTFNTIDQGDDMVMEGAFGASLSTRPAAKVKMLWQHNPTEPIGKWLELREDERGLFARGKLNLKVQRGAEAHELMKDGQIDGMSIGYRTQRYEIDRERGVRKLIQLDLLEVSAVTFPMNTTAAINRVKSGSLPTERQFEEWLTRDAGFSSKQAKAIIADGFKSLLTARDAGGDDQGLAESLSRLSAMLRGAR